MKTLRSALLLLSLLLAGCGTTTSDVAPGNPQSTKTVNIGVIAPLNSGLVEFGRGIRNSVQLAVNQANTSGRYPGIVFRVDARDDSSTPSVGQAAAQSLLNTTNLAGVVGTYNSGVAAAVLPVLSPANIVMISPGNTDPTLTRGADPNNPTRPFANYFRVVVPDSIQGPALANETFSTLKLTRVAIVTEDKAVSIGLVDAYRDAFTPLGGVITVRIVVPAGTTDYTNIITQVKASNPQLVVYGGELATAAVFRNQSVQQGLVVPLMGSDGIKDVAYITGAGAGSEGDFASSVGAPIANLPGGPAFLAAYQASGFAEPPSDFGPYAYDAANLLIAAVGRKGLDRTALLQDVGASNTTGATGSLRFDAFGDTLNKVVTIYQVRSGQFVPRDTVVFP